LETHCVRGGGIKSKKKMNNLTPVSNDMEADVIASIFIKHLLLYNYDQLHARKKIYILRV